VTTALMRLLNTLTHSLTHIGVETGKRSAKGHYCRKTTR